MNRYGWNPALAWLKSLLPKQEKAPAKVRTGAFYQQEFPTLSREVLVEVKPSSRAYRRQRLRDQANKQQRARREALRQGRRTMTRRPVPAGAVFEPYQKDPAMMAAKQLDGAGRVRMTPAQMRRLKKNLGRAIAGGLLDPNATEHIEVNA